MSSVNPNPNFPQRYQPTYVSRYPDRPVYRAASTYEKIYPYTDGILGALYKTGNAASKIKAGSDNFIRALILQQSLRLFKKGQEALFEKYPKLAEYSNAHPILSGLPITALAIGIGLSASLGGGKLWQSLRQKFLDRHIDQGAQKLGQSQGGKIFASLWKPFENFMRKPVVIGGLALGMTAFLGTLLVRRLQDSWNFGREYRQARQETENLPLNPYELRAKVAYQQRLQRLPEPKKLNRNQAIPNPNNLTTPLTNQKIYA